MADVVIPYRFRVKRDTAAAFTAANTLLLSGEFGLETDTRKFKIGDGVTTWDTLPYVNSGTIPEGTNLYHTAARVRDTVLTGLSTATNAVITATDTVLAALGKLQAQISGLIVQTITDGDTTHAPSGDAVFDALAGKADTSSVVSLSGNQTVDGIKRFSANIERFGPAGIGRAMKFMTNSSNRWELTANNAAESGANSGSDFVINRSADDGSFISSALRIQRSNGTVRPGADNAQNLGDASFRWSEVFAGNATINTSDAREKTAPRDLTDEELAAAAEIARLPSIFQWLHAVEEKGDDARLHCSPTVQAVIRVMKKRGLDPFRYGFVCFDDWPERTEPAEYETVEVKPAVTRDHPAIYERVQVYTEDGQPERFAERLVSPAWTEVVEPAVTEQRMVREAVTHPAGDRYSLRPTELAWFVIRGQEARLAALEKLTEMLTKP